MPNDAGFVQHCQELLAPLGTVRVRRMFGGHGLYLDDRFVAIVAGNELFLKADDGTRAQFVDAGCRPFEFSTPDGQRVVMSYWQAPDDAMESPALMQPWARLALGAALRQAAAKAVKPARKAAAKRSAGRSTGSTPRGAAKR